MYKREIMMMKYPLLLSGFLFVAVLSGCSSSFSVTPPAENKIVTPVCYDLPADFRDEILKNKTIEYFSKFLKGKKIYVDAGHGGEDKRNKSLSGAVVEAEVNLRVAKHLQDYLIQSGSIVYMTREDDITVSLAERAESYNKSDAEIFVSIHHNAPSKTEDCWTNYTSTYYHAFPEDYEYEPVNNDIAKYIQRDLSFAVGNSGGLDSFDGTYSDYKHYPGKGFYVLRETKKPAALVECAFHTNSYEEKRLLVDEFNSLEAWGIFRGLGRFFEKGIPEIELLRNESIFARGELKLVFLLSDSSGISPDGCKFYFDEKLTPADFDEKSSRLIADIKNVSDGDHSVRVICRNKYGIHAFPYHIIIQIK